MTRAGRKPGTGPTLAAMTQHTAIDAVTAALEHKAAPGLEEQEAGPEEEIVHEWAGDLYEDGDESDPAEAFSTFAGVEGEEAWLDRADDGTLTGWVRDADGSVYKYVDAEAWGIDVDQAGMQPSSDLPTSPEAAETQDDQLEDLDGTDPVDGEEPPALPGQEDVPLVDDPLDGDLTEDETDPAAPPADPVEDDPNLDPDLDADPDAEDEDEDEEDAPPWEQKSWLTPAGRFTVAPIA